MDTGRLLLGIMVLLGGVRVNATAGGPAEPVQYLSAAERCAQITNSHPQWPDPTTRLITVEMRPEGFQVAGPMRAAVKLPEHCELTALMQERVGADGQRYAIRFHVRLPVNWNGKLVFEGGGGTEGELGVALGAVGSIAPAAIDSGYAVVSQDAGHDNSTNSTPERGGVVAFGLDPEARANYGGAGLEAVGLAAKALVQSYYGRALERSYFVGCSKGGQEGMVFAQRHPDIFDGILAAAPGFSLPRAALAEVWDTQAFASLAGSERGKTFDPKQLPATFSDGQFARVRQAILDACDADDGVRDGITASIGSCTWKRVEPHLRRAKCNSIAGEACLTDAQLAVLERVMRGPKDDAGKALYSDWPIDAGVGSESWRIWKIGTPNNGFPGINVAMGSPALALIFTTPPTRLGSGVQPALDYALRFDFERDAPKIYARNGVFRRSAWEDISARSPQLSRFRAHGGKMIVPHGAADPVFSLNDTLAWYREVDQLNKGTASDFVRVFPVPGMAHCGGGPTTDQFDAFAALVKWVELGAPPDSIIAKAGPQSPWPGRTRPLCAYPKVARYRGAGNIEDAASFRCQ